MINNNIIIYFLKLNFRHDKLVNLYKQCYIQTLRPDTMSGFTLIKHIMEVLRQLNYTLKQTKS